MRGVPEKAKDEKEKDVDVDGGKDVLALSSPQQPVKLQAQGQRRDSAGAEHFKFHLPKPAIRIGLDVIPIRVGLMLVDDSCRLTNLDLNTHNNPRLTALNPHGFCSHLDC